MMVSIRMSVGLLSLTGLLIPAVMPSTADAQEIPRLEARELEQRERAEREREEFRRDVERERDEIRRNAERERDEMRREAERRAEEFDRPRPRGGEMAEAFEQQRREQMEREHHRMMLEGHRLDFEMHKLHMERVATQARIAGDPVLSAAFALERLPELVPNERERREVLEDFLDASQNPAIKRLIRMKLLELPAEGLEREELIEVIESLIE
ncbi:hypothetical protein [Bremerella sp. P1]|uniref:hypothetical protein n=1 Tax=Bremerella sp. P1 TaxID=3026424 RepID=UPI002368DF89|nr:hypothetical protein [Bremerella sp. P1]WDI44500.1 hypothetical protein PSR63_11205 [Bremerella sp. P1]